MSAKTSTDYKTLRNTKPEPQTLNLKPTPSCVGKMRVLQSRLTQVHLREEDPCWLSGVYIEALVLRIRFWVSGATIQGPHAIE